MNCLSTVKHDWIVNELLHCSFLLHYHAISVSHRSGTWWDFFFSLLFHRCLRVCSSKMSAWNGRMWRKEKWRRKKMCKKANFEEKSIVLSLYSSCVVDVSFFFLCISVESDPESSLNRVNNLKRNERHMLFVRHWHVIDIFNARFSHRINNFRTLFLTLGSPLRRLSLDNWMCFKYLDTLRPNIMVKARGFYVFGVGIFSCVLHIKLVELRLFRFKVLNFYTIFSPSRPQNREGGSEWVQEKFLFSKKQSLKFLSILFFIGRWKS